MDRPVRRIASWNADGLKTRRPELIQFLTDQDVDVALIQETHLRPEVAFTVPNYAVYRADRVARPGRGAPRGGAAVLVHRRVPHRQLDRPDIPHEAATVGVQFRGAELRITSIYVPPKAPVTGGELDTLLAPDIPAIVAGDFNAKNPEWGCRVANAKGRRLSELLLRRPHVTLAAPDEPTHYHHLGHRPDILDIALHCGVPAAVTARVLCDLSSDHVPVVIDLEDPRELMLPPSRPRRVHWGVYKQLLETRPPLPVTPAVDAAALDTQVSQLQGYLQEAVQTASRPAPAPVDRRRALPPDLRQEIRLRRHLRREWQRSRCPRTKADFNRQSRRVTALLQEHSNEQWRTFLDEQAPEDGSLWRLAKSLRGPKKTTNPLRGQHGLVFSQADKAEAFADSLEGQFAPHEDVHDEDHAQHVADFLAAVDPEDEDDDPLPEVSEEEVTAALAALKPKKAPGPDMLGAAALRGLPPWVVSLLTRIFNSCFRLHHFPSPWKTAKVILIPKPKKDPLIPENYRPISLLPILSKILERLILSRFPPEFHLSIRSEQFGFRRGHSTTLQLARVINSTAAALQRRESTTCVLVDVSKAFDRVWHEGLLYKLAHSPLPRWLFHLLRSYLQQRTFVVALGATTSSTRPILAGVPQGSVLGPILYLWYTNDMPVVPRVRLALYADDALFQASSINPRQAAVYMQRQMTALEPWLRKWRVKTNVTKSEAICFTRKTFQTSTRTDIILNGEVVPWKRRVKYLGVTLDRQLTMAPHVDNRCRQIAAAAACLYPLLGHSSTLTLKIKLMLYTMVIRPALLYAAPAWYHLASATARKKMEVQQTKILRRISKSPWYVSNATIRTSAGIPSIKDFATRLTAAFKDKAENSDFDHLRDIVTQPTPQLRLHPP